MGWGIVLEILGVILPVKTVNTARPGVQPMRSLVAVHGYAVLLPVGIPLLVAIIVALFLRGRGCAQWSRITARILSISLLLTALVGFVTFLIGIYVVPAGILLVVASIRSAGRR